MPRVSTRAAGGRNDATTANTAKKLSGVDARTRARSRRGRSRARRARARSRARGSTGPTTARPRPGRSSRGTRSGSIDWKAGKPMALAHPAPSTISVTRPGLGSPRLATNVSSAANRIWNDVVDEQQRAAGHAVGERATERGEQRGGHEPGGGDEPGPPGLARRRGDEDADADRLHPRADVRHERARPQQREAPVPERRERTGEVHRRRRYPATPRADRGATANRASTRCSGANVPSQS